MICQRRVKAFVGMNSNYQWQLVLVCEKMPNDIECECCNEIKSISRVLMDIKELKTILPECERQLLLLCTDDNSYHVAWETQISNLNISAHKATIFYGTIVSH